MGLLCEGATFDNEYMELENEAGFKSRVWENGTHGSVRGSRQAFHAINRTKEVSRLFTRRCYASEDFDNNITGKDMYKAIKDRIIDSECYYLLVDEMQFSYCK